MRPDPLGAAPGRPPGRCARRAPPPCGRPGYAGPAARSARWRAAARTAALSAGRATRRRNVPCSRCGQTAGHRVLSLPQGPGCVAAAMRRPPRRCGGCGQDRPIRLRAAAGQPDLCSHCAALASSSLRGMRAAGTLRFPRAASPLCMICCTWPVHAMPILRPGPAREGAVANGTRLRRLLPADPRPAPRTARAAASTRCSSPPRTTAPGPAGHAPATRPSSPAPTCAATETGPGRRHLRPVRDEPAAARHARRSRPGHPGPAPARPGRVRASRQPRIGHRLARRAARRRGSWPNWLQTAHHRQLTHALLDERPKPTRLHHVRDVLVQRRHPSRREPNTSTASIPGSDAILTGRAAAPRPPRAPLRDLARAAPRPARVPRQERLHHVSAAGLGAKPHPGRPGNSWPGWMTRGQTLGTATQADVDELARRLHPVTATCCGPSSSGPAPGTSPAT